MSTLDGFSEGTFEHDGTSRTVFRRGEGPAVIIIEEVPGITPLVAAFARRVADLGCTAVMPSLFGTPGKEPSALYALQTAAGACVSREFTMFVRGRASPITVWLRALAHHEHEACGGPGVGAVGMCLTGGFALAMMVDETVLAPVLSQPSLPVALTKAHRRDLGISDADLARIKERCATEDLCVLGLRFTGDKLAPAERFVRLREELGDAFVGVEIDSSPGNPSGHPKAAHSVLTEHLIDEPGQPTRDALDQVLDLFRSKLLADQA
ncbi:MAG: Dienelactone hydrolase [Acidimicrobiales bacterium]|nr:Dienelactone hydrolase [Acidimicrobiales bacterium]